VFLMSSAFVQRFGDLVSGVRVRPTTGTARGGWRFRFGYNYVLHAPVAQWIERRPPEPGAQVRFLPGARYFSRITSSRLPAVMEAW
jgi:hypothetical protein